MNLSRALKMKNRLVSRLNDLNRLIAENNVIIKGNKRVFDIDSLGKSREEVLDNLVKIKVLIDEANGPIREKIYMMSEFKAQVVFLRSLPTQEGRVKTRLMSDDSNMEYEAHLSASQIDERIRNTNNRIDELQDEIDLHNASTNIDFEIDERILYS